MNKCSLEDGTGTYQVSWRSYMRDRMIKEDPTGFFIIVPVGAELPIPLACTTCDQLLRSRDDEVAFHEFHCCHLCALQWAHPRRKEWHEGWRPSPEQVATVVLQRPPLLVAFDID